MTEIALALLGKQWKGRVALALVVVSGVIAFDRWGDQKAYAVEERVMFIRGLDMEHLNKRFDVIEGLLRDSK